MVAAVALVSSILVVNWVPADDAGDRPAATFFMPLEVPVVNVEVVVTDDDGVPITGLTAADFEVLEDGEPVKISNFFASRLLPEEPGSPAIEPPPDPLPDQQLYLVLYIDDLDTDPRSRTVVLDHLREFLEQPLPPNVKTMLVRFDGQLHVASDLTDDTDQLLAALDVTRDMPVTSRQRDEQALLRQMQRATTDRRDQIQMFFNTLHPPTTADPDRRPLAFDEPDNQPVYQNFLPQIHAVARAAHLRSQASLAALQQFVDYLNGVPGRKAVVWVGGMDTRPGEELFLAWEELFPNVVRQQGIQPMMEAQRYDLTLDLQQLLEVANSERISFYTVSSLGAGLERISSTEESGRDPSRTSAFTDIWGQEDALHMMSGFTGGRMLVDNRNLDRQLTEVSTELGSYYSLGYTPPSPGDGEYHTITVKVRRQGVQVRHRMGYRFTPARDPMTDRTLAAATLGIADNPLGIALAARPQEPRPEGGFLVPVEIRIPLGDLVLLPQGDHHAANISVVSVVRDDHGRLSDVHDRMYPIEIPNDELMSAVSQQTGFVLGMVLRGGPHRIAISVQDNNSMTESTAYLDIVVGDEPAGRSG